MGKWELTCRVMNRHSAQGLARVRLASPEGKLVSLAAEGFEPDLTLSPRSVAPHAESVAIAQPSGGRHSSNGGLDWRLTAWGMLLHW